MSLRGEWNVSSRLDLGADVEVGIEDGQMAWSSNEAFLHNENGWNIGREDEAPEDLGSGDYVLFDRSGALNSLFGLDEAYYVPVFGRRDTRSVDFTLQASVTFSPKLSLQLYSQLFVARGRYDDFHVLTDPDTLVPIPSYPKRDEFSFSSFQTNTVLRWEYRPGSTLFLVWTHGRNLDDELNPLAPWGASPYNTPISDQVDNTFGIFPSNVFMIKLNYHLPAVRVGVHARLE